MCIYVQVTMQAAAECSETDAPDRNNTATSNYTASTATTNCGKNGIVRLQKAPNSSSIVINLDEAENDSSETDLQLSLFSG